MFTILIVRSIDCASVIAVYLLALALLNFLQQSGKGQGYDLKLESDVKPVSESGTDVAT